MSLSLQGRFFLRTVVYMAWDVMILMGEHPLQGPLERGGPERGPERGPEMAISETSVIWPKKVKIFRAPPFPMALVMDLTASKSLSPSTIKKGKLEV